MKILQAKIELWRPRVLNFSTICSSCWPVSFVAKTFLLNETICLKNNSFAMFYKLTLTCPFSFHSNYCGTTRRLLKFHNNVFVKQCPYCKAVVTITTTFLSHKVKTQYVHCRLIVSYFPFSWRIPANLSRRSIVFHN